MLNKIEILIEMQELDLILKEAKIVHQKDVDSESIRNKLEKLRNSIDAQTLSRFDRLIKQGLSVVQLRGGMCLGCNLSIPVGDINRIKANNAEPICPNCGKFVIV
jgi:predicted  nucleic acid-binding Zn-ribbon protein